MDASLRELEKRAFLHELKNTFAANTLANEIARLGNKSKSAQDAIIKAVARQQGLQAQREALSKTLRTAAGGEITPLFKPRGMNPLLKKLMIGTGGAAGLFALYKLLSRNSGERWEAPEERRGATW